MRKSVSSLALLAAIAGLMAHPSAPAAWAGEESGNAVRKGESPVRILFDDERVRVQEITFRPGAQGPGTARPFRIMRVLKGGTMQRTYPDGRTETIEYKTGELRVVGPDRPFVPKNVGNSDIVFYVVALKDAGN
jgi:mannose-6-phosphate isomerase-like protein (cupin superfamily)